MNFEILLPWFRTVTEEYQEQMGVWSVAEQINHIFTEVGELNQAFRKNKPLEQKLEELWDIALSAITISHLIPECTDDMMLDAFERVIAKLKQRMRMKHYAKRGIILRKGASSA